MNNIALVTGATAGIGKATAIKLAQNNYNLIITGRRTKLLDELEQKIKKEFGVKCISLSFDIRDNEAVHKSIDKLPEEWRNIDILINNSGLASGLDPIQTGKIDDWEQMIDTNLKGLLYITRKLTPGMIDRKKGHIINIGSIAGKEVYPNGNVYCSTKHAIDALTKAMRIDLVQHGIKVTQVAPGMVETEFSKVRFKGDAQKAERVYQGFTPLYAEDVAETILFVLNRPMHVNINDILITATAQASSTIIHKENQ